MEAVTVGGCQVSILCENQAVKPLKAAIEGIDGSYSKSAYVRLNHGDQYKVRIAAPGHDVRVDASVYIDGYYMGAFVLSRGRTLDLERSSTVAKKFTFYKADSKEGRKGELLLAGKDLGLLRVVFAPEQRMEVTIIPLSGATYTVSAGLSDDVWDLKKKLSDLNGTPVSQQKLVFEGKLLMNEELLSDVGVGDHSVIHHLLQLRGGGEARESNGYKIIQSKHPAIIDGAACKLFASCNGGTALSGNSLQSFVSVAASEYEAVKEVNLRLVCATDKSDNKKVPQPEMSLREAQSNAYPPPLDFLAMSASDDSESEASYSESETSSYGMA